METISAFRGIGSQMSTAQILIPALDQGDVRLARVVEQ